MKFEIYSTSIYPNCYSDYSGQRLVEEYPCLKDFGFEIVKYEVTKRERIFDENGDRIWAITGTDIRYKAFVEIDTIEQLVDLGMKCGYHGLVLKDETIEIYDGYRE